MTSMFDYDDSVNLAFDAKIAGKNLVTAKHELLQKTGDFLFLAHTDKELAYRMQMVESDIEKVAYRKLANVSDSKAKLVRAVYDEWQIRHASCNMCKVAWGWNPISDIGQAISGVGNAIGQGVRDVGHGIGAAGHAVGQAAGAVVHGVEHGIQDLPQNLGNWGKDVGQAAGSAVRGVEQGIGAAGHAIGQGAKDVGQAAGSAVRGVEGFGKAVGRDVSNWAGTAARGAETVGKDVLHGAETVGKGLLAPAALVGQAAGALAKDVQQGWTKGMNPGSNAQQPGQAAGKPAGPTSPTSPTSTTSTTSPYAMYPAGGKPAPGKPAPGKPMAGLDDNDNDNDPGDINENNPLITKEPTPAAPAVGPTRPTPTPTPTPTVTPTPSVNHPAIYIVVSFPFNSAKISASQIAAITKKAGALKGSVLISGFRSQTKPGLDYTLPQNRANSVLTLLKTLNKKASFKVAASYSAISGVCAKYAPKSNNQCVVVYATK